MQMIQDKASEWKLKAMSNPIQRLPLTSEKVTFWWINWTEESNI